MFLHPDFEGLEIVTFGKEIGRESISVPGIHRDKRNELT